MSRKRNRQERFCTCITIIKEVLESKLSNIIDLIDLVYDYSHCTHDVEWMDTMANAIYSFKIIYPTRIYRIAPDPHRRFTLDILHIGSRIHKFSFCPIVNHGLEEFEQTLLMYEKGLVEVLQIDNKTAFHEWLTDISDALYRHIEVWRKKND